MGPNHQYTRTNAKVAMLSEMFFFPRNSKRNQAKKHQEA